MGSKNFINSEYPLVVRASSVPAVAASAGKIGAVAGGVVSAMHNTYRFGRGDIKATEAISNVVKDTVGTGLATAAGAVAITMVGITGLVGVAGFVTVAALTKGAWDSMFYNTEKKKRRYLRRLLNQ